MRAVSKKAPADSVEPSIVAPLYPGSVTSQNILSIDGFERIHPYQLNGSCGIELSSIFVIIHKSLCTNIDAIFSGWV